MRSDLVHVVDPELLDHILLNIVNSYLVVGRSLNDKTTYSSRYLLDILLSLIVRGPTSSVNQSTPDSFLNFVYFKVFCAPISLQDLEFRLNFLDNILNACATAHRANLQIANRKSRTDLCDQRDFRR